MQEMLPGFLAALSLSASLLLVPTLLTQVGAPFMGIYTASMLMAIAGTLAFGRLGLPVAAAPGAALTSWLVAVVMLAHGVSWQMVLFMGAVVSLVMTATLAFTVFSKRPGRLAGLVQLFPPCIADGLQGAVGLLLLVQGLYQGHLLMGSPTGPVQLGNMADPVAYISLVGIIAMLSLMAVGARWAVLGGVLTSAVLAFAGGFWVLPDAPFFLPEGLDRTGLQLIFMNGWENVKVCDYADLSLVLTLFLILSGWGGLKALAPHLDDGQMGRSLLSLSGLSFIACHGRPHGPHGVLDGSFPSAPALHGADAAVDGLVPEHLRSSLCRGGARTPAAHEAGVLRRYCRQGGSGAALPHPAADAGRCGRSRGGLHRLRQPDPAVGRARQPLPARAGGGLPLVFFLWFLVNLVTRISYKECFDSCQCIGIRMENIC